MELFCFDLLKVIAKVIDNKKGNNPVVLDVRAISQLTDYFIFAEGNVGVHVKALADTIVQELKEHKCRSSTYRGVKSWRLGSYRLWIYCHPFVYLIH